LISLDGKKGKPQQFSAGQIPLRILSSLFKIASRLNQSEQEQKET
jgi:hypothetical protein